MVVPTCGFKGFFSCVLTAGVRIFLLTAPKALRPDGRGVCKVLAVIEDKSFSGWGKKKAKNNAHFHMDQYYCENKKISQN